VEYKNVLHTLQREIAKIMALYEDGEYAKALCWDLDDLTKLRQKYNLKQTTDELARIMEQCDENGDFDDAVDEMYQEIERLTVIVAQKEKGKE
jgi:hypothetical protein